MGETGCRSPCQLSIINSPTYHLPTWKAIEITALAVCNSAITNPKHLLWSRKVTQCHEINVYSELDCGTFTWNSARQLLLLAVQTRPSNRILKQLAINFVTSWAVATAIILTNTVPPTRVAFLLVSRCGEGGCCLCSMGMCRSGRSNRCSSGNVNNRRETTGFICGVYT